MTIRTLVILTLSLIVACCSDRISDTRLSAVEELASTSPKEALDSLEVIDYDLLSDADKHYYDFLSVKVSDKAYITHTSDSLILKVIDYESRNKGNGRYAEALYYGGRVYSDLGDSPTALKYFQQALDIINTDNLHLQKRVLSQTGRLLNSLRLYDKAIPYIQKAIQTDSILKDSVNQMYDLHLLGAINLHADNLDSAEVCLNKAWDLAKMISHRDTLHVKLYLAALQYRKHNTDSALLLIRDVPEKIHPISRNTALACAARIYLASEKLDSAYIYAHQIITSGDPNNRKTGYQILMSDQLRNFIPSDSIGYYFNDYSRILEDYFNQNQKESTILQDSYYNYQVHVRERKKIENQKSQLIGLVYIITTVLLILTIFIISLKYRQKSNLIKLRKALDNIERLEHLLQSKDKKQPIGNSDLITEHEPHGASIEITDASELKTRLRQKLLALSQTQQPEVSLKIIQSEAYTELQTYISQERFISDNNPLWNALESIVLEESGNFKEHLFLLSGGDLKQSTYHLALLLKCGVTPTQLTTLIGRTKGTISYHRAQLCAKILGENLGAKTIDNIIRLL